MLPEWKIVASYRDWSCQGSKFLIVEGFGAGKHEIVDSCKDCAHEVCTIEATVESQHEVVACRRKS